MLEDPSYDRLVAGLITEMSHMPVIDSHEHLPAEDEVVAEKADVFTRIYCHYSVTGAVTAGMPGDRLALKDTSVPLAERWARFSPYLPAIRDMGYARAAQITARDLYGIDDINDDTYALLSQRVQAANTPGLYSRILQGKCGIERVLNQGSWDAGADGLAVSVYRGFMGLSGLSPDAVRRIYGEWCASNGSDFADAASWVEHWLGTVAAPGRGCVGIKFSASLPPARPEDAAAEQVFRTFRCGAIADHEASVLGTWLMHKAIERAPEYGLVVAVHCGLNWCCWNDFAALNPMRLVPLLQRYRETTFDLYHGGIPWVREMAVIGNQYPNAQLNLIWCHQISPYMTEHMLNEWLDLVPSNKIIGFGGDNCFGPEKTYGVLVMMRENIARALAVRLLRGQMSESRAVQVCRDWLYNNPKRIYGV